MRAAAGKPGRRSPSFRKAMGWLHLWLGLTSGLIVFIISITGCIYVFEKEIKSLAYADRMYVDPGSSGLKPVGELWLLAQKALGPERPIQRVQISGGADRSYVFGSYKSDPGALTFFGEQVRNYKVFVNPYDGSILKVENTKFEFFNLVLWLHWSLLLSNKIGQPIVGSAVLVFVVMLISGLVLWWPRNRTALKARLGIAWKAKWKRLNWDLHSVAGFYALIFALLIALTGLVWAFDWFEKSVYFLAMGKGKPAGEAALVSDTASVPGVSPLDLAFAHAHAHAPGYRELYLSVPDKKSGVISAFARFGTHSHYKTERMQFDRQSGALLKTRSFSDLDRGEKLGALNYDLHVGSILGLPGKILAFLASLTCATLPWTGFFIWLGKRKRKSERRWGAV